MAEYLIQGETLNSLADKIRTLSGTENLLKIVTMTEKVNEANTEISEQTDLISQMNTALDDLGAIAGGSGGGSGGNVETCNVTFGHDFLSPMTQIYHYTNANMEIETLTAQEGSLVVVKNTLVAIENWSNAGTASGECERLFFAMGYAVYKVTGDCTLVFYG